MDRQPGRRRRDPAIKVDLLRAHAGRNEVAVLRYEARRPRGVTIVAGHGYSSSKQNLDSLCAFLASHGFAVYSLDFPGHKLGASGGRLDAVDDLLAAFSAAIRLAREDGEGTLYTLGHSMGAVAALCSAAADAAVHGVVSIATGHGRPAALAALSRRGVVDLRSSYVDGLSLTEIAAAWEPRLTSALPRLAGRPALFIAAETDGMVAAASVRELFDRAPDPKSFATVAGNHTNAGENSRAAILSWLGERHLRPAPAGSEAAL
jgi:pimeloyl-ACP methyl ester carboxylesterase